jgi:hypothetical protein
MRTFTTIIAFTAIFLLLAGFGQQQQKQSTPKDVNLSITKVDTVWKVVLTGTTTTAVHVVPGQKIIFHAEGTDVYFQFDNDKLFGGHIRSLRNGKKLTLGVGQVAKGVYTYSAFCEGPKVFARGDSPPKIIVD